MRFPQALFCALFALYVPITIQAQQAPSAAAEQGEPETLSAEQATKRNDMMRPAFERLRANDPAGAYAAMKPVLAAYPDDLRVLRYTAQAAEAAGKEAEAIPLFDRALLLKPKQPWPLRLGRMEAEAHLAGAGATNWDAFNRDLADLRAAKKAGTDAGLASSNGFVVDSFQAGGVLVQTVIFPMLAGSFHTLYRFLLPVGAAARTTVQAQANSPDQDRCHDPKFQPYLDVESDDSDQASFVQAHPDRAAKGDRLYSLDTYGGPCSQGLIKFYPEGEPAYQTVRGDVIKALAGQPKGAKE